MKGIEKEATKKCEENAEIKETQTEKKEKERNKRQVIERGKEHIERENRQNLNPFFRITSRLTYMMISLFFSFHHEI